MVTRLRLLVIALALITGVAHAGENVRLLDADGRALGTSQIDRVSSRATCAPCHDDFDAKARSVHFARRDKAADPDSVDCLSCHMGKLSKDGTISKTIAVPAADTCRSCHPNAQREHRGQPHAGMSCCDCHKDAGHKSSGAASCKGCHFGKGKAPKPKHAGFTKLHMDFISCGSCHLAGACSGKFGFSLKSKRIMSVDADCNPVHHGMAPARDALGGRGGCADCHSNKSRFFFGMTATGDTDDKGKPIRIPNYTSIGISQNEVRAGAIRETVIKPLSKWVFLFVIVLCAVHYAVFGPRRAKVSRKDAEVLRFNVPERIFHLLALVSFLFLAIAGLIFLLRLETPFSALREIHGCVGGIFAVSVVGMFFLWRKEGVFTKCDIEWVKMMGGYLWAKGDCPAEKFNAGQKLYFWTIAILFGLVISVTGFMLHMGEGHAAGWVFTMHDFAAVVLIVGVIVHAYLSIFANPGAIHSMLTGRVKRSWAEHHHPDWLRKHFGN